MFNRPFHNEDGTLNQGSLDHDTEMFVRNEVIDHFERYGVTQPEIITSIRRVLTEIEEAVKQNHYCYTGAQHSMMRDTRPDGKDYWTTECAFCGEVPSCGNHDWEPQIDTINGEDEFTLICRNCGHKQIVDQQLFNIVEVLDGGHHDNI